MFGHEAGLGMRGNNLVMSTSLPALHASLIAHKGSVNVARYAKGSAKYILTGGQDRTVRLWNAGSGAEIKVFNAHGYEVLCIAVFVLLA
jgi:WD40 repeat protein